MKKILFVLCSMTACLSAIMPEDIADFCDTSADELFYIADNAPSKCMRAYYYGKIKAFYEVAEFIESSENEKEPG